MDTIEVNFILHVVKIKTNLENAIYSYCILVSYCKFKYPTKELVRNEV